MYDPTLSENNTFTLSSNTLDPNDSSGGFGSLELDTLTNSQSQQSLSSGFDVDYFQEILEASTNNNNLEDMNTSTELLSSEQGEDTLIDFRSSRLMRAFNRMNRRSRNINSFGGDLLTGTTPSILPSSSSDNAGNTFSSARVISVDSNATSYSDWVGNADTIDYYRFSLNDTSDFDLTLSGLAEDIDVSLYNSAGSQIANSDNWGTSSESITEELNAGTYYIRVYPYNGAETNYNLSVSATPLVPVDNAGNTFSSARVINVDSNATSYSDWVGNADTIDYYRFSLNDTSDFDLTLSGLTEDIDVRLYDSAGSQIANSDNWGTASETITEELNTGTYYIQVYPFSGAETNYNLSVSATPLVPIDNAGNTFSNARVINVDSNATIYSDWVGNADTNDYYRFSLNDTSDFDLTLSGLTEDIDVRLYDSAGSQIAYSGNVGTASESITEELNAGTYYIRVYPYNGAETNYTLSVSASVIPQTNLSFSSFDIFDASGDSTSNSIFQGGAIRLSYDLLDTTSFSSVRLEALGNNETLTLGSWNQGSLSNSLINLADFSNLTGGDYQFRAVAQTTDGQDFFSNTESINVLSWTQPNNTIYGTFRGETLNYSGNLDTGTVVVGLGGTDTLNLTGISSSNVTGINGVSLSSFDPFVSTDQAIFQGTAFDYLTLADGREIYFQGIENLQFSDNQSIELQIRTNDPYFKDQWNLHVSDVGSAWRFTQGSDDVLLVSLDSGILTAHGAPGDIFDIPTNPDRLIVDWTDDDNHGDNGHGHQAISVMSSIPNNNSGVAGINWNSDVYVVEPYYDVTLQQGIQDAINYARANGQRIVFQGGIQGENWLNHGGTQQQLEQLIAANSDITLFAVAAGNGNIDIDNTNPYNSNVQKGLSGGVARLQTTHDNVMAVGALENKDSVGNWANTWVNGLMNAGTVRRAPYSNFGQSLTLMAATDSPAMDKFGNMNYFSGTSAANPNMAGIASLVWSVNADLDGGELRQILIDTAMDIGTVGRDNTFGHGLVNADAAVRRAVALESDEQLTRLYSGRSIFA